MSTTPQAADETWLRAVVDRDAAAAEEVLHPEYALVLVHPVPSRVVRTEWLAMLPFYVVSGWTELGSAWDESGDVAAHLHTVDMQAAVNGVDRSGVFVLTDVFRRDGARGWQVWRRYSTPFTAGAMPRPLADG